MSGLRRFGSSEERTVHDLRLRAGQLPQRLLGELAYGVFAWVPGVYHGDGRGDAPLHLLPAEERGDLRGGEVHVAPERLDEVVAVLERSRLAAVAEERDVPVRERLHYEVRDDASVLGVHLRTVRVEDAHHPDVHPVLPAVVGAQRLRDALALVVAAPEPDRVDVAPVLLDLRMHERVAVYLARRGVEHARLRLERELEHVHRAEHGALRRLDGVLLVVDRRGGAGEVVYLVELPPERLRDVVQHEREALVVEELVDVLLRAREEVVQRGDLVSVRKKPLAEMAAEESRATSYQCFFHIPVAYAV